MSAETGNLATACLCTLDKEPPVLQQVCADGVEIGGIGADGPCAALERRDEVALEEVCAGGERNGVGCRRNELVADDLEVFDCF